jgi:hypothetical protein
MKLKKNLIFKIGIVYLYFLINQNTFASTIRHCVDDPYSVQSCSNQEQNSRIKNNVSKISLNWDLLNIKTQTNHLVSINSAIEITQADVTQLASNGNSWVVFGGANSTMNMNIGVSNNSSPQNWSLPTNFQEFFDYYTQDDFISPSSVPVPLQLAGATNITKSTYVTDTDEEFEVYEHFNINASSVDHLGRSFDFDIDDDAFDEPDYEFMNVPLSLGDVMNNTIDQFDYETDQLLYRTVTTLTIDAYGTLTIPGYGTYDCLRGTYQSQFYKRPNETSSFVLQNSSNSIGFMTKQGHFFQAKIVSQTGQNAILENLSFKAIVPTALLDAPSNLKLNNDNKGISINTSDADAHPSAILDIDSDSLGVLIPRITEVNRPSNPAEGLLIYQVDNTPGFYYFDGTDWQMLSTTTPVASIASQNARIGTSITSLGKGQLKKGSTFIKFDKSRDDFEDLIINIQLESDCNGVYISKKTRDGFEIKELKKGKSKAKFSWGIK